MSDELIGQNEIEELLRQAKAGNAPSAAAGTPPQASNTPDPSLGQAEIEALLSKTQSPAATPPSAATAGLDKTLGQNEIESLLNQAGAGSTRPGAPPRFPAADSAEPHIAPGDMEFLFNQAQQALASVDAPSPRGPLAGIAPFRLEDFSGAPASAEVATLELIRDVELDLKIELGRTQMYLEDVLKLRKGSVVPLDKLAGDPVDIYVNGRLIARGEVLVLNDNFCVRVAELVTAEAARAG